MIALSMFAVVLVLLLIGIPVAFVFGAVSIAFALLIPDLGLEVFSVLPFRVYGIMSNTTLMAVPLFIAMGLILEKSQMAERLLIAMSALFRDVRGGLGVSVVLVGAMLAASTGIVSASVVMMSVIALPLMLKAGYDKGLASGTVAASGTLGQIIPPSIILIILGDVMSVSVGELFMGALLPGIVLVGLYIAYILIRAYVSPELAPIPKQKIKVSAKEIVLSILPPMLLMMFVLGSIFAGVASPTESAAFGALGALLLAKLNKSLSFEMLKYASLETVKLSGMIFMILIGATAFSLVFNELGGSDLILEFFSEDIGDVWIFIAVAMVSIFILGFFIDFIEISFIIVPILVPIMDSFGIDPIWFAVLIALNLQASFLTPPFGLSLFFLKGAAGDSIKTMEIYKGIVPFILLQFFALLLVIIFPDLVFAFL
ncbi:MAG: TRAP transporter large permease subunit [Epsilonproteobacteria bacterium]|nr:TRAP transporter large permease subunit [Campylobacterota bacterium]OIO17247.1 MAG: C4-dicarboxylate ABC transporter [Helicobacteraceae bacterium CG1_02_36_14]PIP10052.1 MAG: C4-dicarboxylate ABC transporter [Sulfurimonas sp. CG23_combo_of_CG06-09_8_20_14_all_36_33]PIS23648.1 MAG: C4-dicarboxylate ABC transporter [Sulfurimonas sp. CG08_land_8_20_14_0_20_36_33]PIU34849.1 MAG: C4-dicarboxylate ABC transporter [Sulfurimonas sp. CG07_land_8_20_14_0_80_36_56]PIV05103.1 MAG: C4-dicarboxylate ABC 